MSEPTTKRGPRYVDDEVTLGEVYRLVLSAIQQLTGIGSRLDGLDKQYLRADLYAQQRINDRQAVTDLKTALEARSSTGWKLVTGVVVPFVVAAGGAGLTILLWAAERH